MKTTYFPTSSKYSNIKQTYDGYSYDSKFEAQYAAQLDILCKGKVIKKWERQVKIDLRIKGVHICNYYIDFVVHHPDGIREYVEVKGFETDVWKLKWKMFEALYGGKANTKLTIVRR
jgi:hypothetical protein